MDNLAALDLFCLEPLNPKQAPIRIIAVSYCFLLPNPNVAKMGSTEMNISFSRHTRNARSVVTYDDFFHC